MRERQGKKQSLTANFKSAYFINLNNSKRATETKKIYIFSEGEQQ